MEELIAQITVLDQVLEDLENLKYRFQEELKMISTKGLIDAISDVNRERDALLMKLGEEVFNAQL